LYTSLFGGKKLKKILIIGAGFLQSFLIERAKQLGYYTIALDKNSESIGFKYSDKYYIADIVDKVKCLEIAKKEKIDAVITGATDYGVLTVSFIAEKLNLKAVNYETVELVKNKYRVRKVFFENKVDELEHFHEISDIENLKEQEFKLPLIVKPIDGSGSKGITKVIDQQTLREAISFALDNSIEKKALMESFISGEEYGVESFVYEGEVYLLGILKKKITREPFYAEVCHEILPNNKTGKNIERVVKKAINTLGIDFGSVNMDLIITELGKIVVIDVGVRMGGNLIGSHIIPIGKRLDYLGLIINTAFNDFDKSLLEKIDFNKFNPIQTRILTLDSGIVKELPNVELIEKKYAVKIFHNLYKGKEINEYKNNLDSSGYIISFDNNNIGKNLNNAFKEFNKSIVRY